MFTQNTETITKKISDFRKGYHKGFRNDFINACVPTFESTLGESAKSLSDAQIARLREKWAIENYKAIEFIKLQREIRGLMNFAQKGNIGWFRRLIQRVTKIPN